MASLNLTFDNITNADLLVGDASVVGDWNTFFDLPTNGDPYTGVTISGNTVILEGSSNVTLTNGLSYTSGLFANNEHITSVYDDGTVIGFGEGVFYQCTGLTSAEFLGVTTIGDDSEYVFATDTVPMNLAYISFPNLISAGNRFFAYVSNVIGSVDCVFNLPLLQIAGEACFTSCSLITTIDLPLLTTAGISCFDYNTSLINVNLPNLITGDTYCFYYCPSLVIIDLPLLTTAGSYFFGDCFALTNIDLPSCTDLGGTVGDDSVFYNITGNTITLTVPPVLMTCNSGSPDGDIQYLQANNTVTIVEVTPTPSPTPTPTPSPTGSIVITPTPTPTKTSTPTPSITPTNTPSPTFIPYTGVPVNEFYAYDINILGNFSGGTAPSGSTAPHPIMIGNDGIPYAQMNAIQIGGFGGLNN